MAYQKNNLLVNEKKSDVEGWLSATLKSTETWDFQLPAFQKLCQDTCQHLMLHPLLPTEPPYYLKGGWSIFFCWYF